ncbi:MAG TPA: LytR C-terminal domain-containing protein [Gemmatimonadales bacterium]
MTRRGRRIVVAATLLAVGAAGAWFVARRGDAVEARPLEPRAALALSDSARAPQGVRVRVEVLNASSVRGLARRATMHLRDRGFDVVTVGNAGERRDSTLVLVRAGDAEWAARVARAMGGAPVEARPDSSRYLDVTVLVGSSWRPPPGPFRP